MAAPPPSQTEPIGKKARHGSIKPSNNREFRQKCATFSKYFALGQISQAVVAFYAEDAVLEGQGLRTQRGHKAIQGLFSEVRNLYTAINIKLDAVTIGKDVAYGSIQNVNVRVDGGTERHHGLLVWRRIGEEWLVDRDFFFQEHAETQPPTRYRRG